MCESAHRAGRVARVFGATIFFRWHSALDRRILRGALLAEYLFFHQGVADEFIQLLAVGRLSGL